MQYSHCIVIEYAVVMCTAVRLNFRLADRSGQFFCHSMQYDSRIRNFTQDTENIRKEKKHLITNARVKGKKETICTIRNQVGLI